MKQHALFFLFLLLFLALPAQQKCATYDCMMQQGQTAFNKKDFVTAFKKFKGAKAFLEGDKKRSDEIDVWIEKTFDGIDAQRQEAIENKKKADENARIAKENAAIAAENERVAKANEQKANSFLEEVGKEKAKTEAISSKLAEQTTQKQKILDAIGGSFNNRIPVVKEINKKMLFGFMNQNGDMIIQYKYEEASPFDADNLARVKKDSLDYLIDTLGNEYRVAYNLEDLNQDIFALDLSNKNLNYLDGAIFKNTQLNILRLQNNHLSELPFEIGRLKNLIYLNILGNTLTERISFQIKELKHLKYLFISLNYWGKPEDNILKGINLLLPYCSINPITYNSSITTITTYVGTHPPLDGTPSLDGSGGIIESASGGGSSTPSPAYINSDTQTISLDTVRTDSPQESIIIPANDTNMSEESTEKVNNTKQVPRCIRDRNNDKNYWVRGTSIIPISESEIILDIEPQPAPAGSYRKE